MNSWSMPKDIKDKVNKRWEKGDILRNILSEDETFPIKIKLNSPTESDMVKNFSDIINWAAKLKSGEKQGYEIHETQRKYRIVGRNSIPTHAVIPSAKDAIKLIKKQAEVDLFIKNSQMLLDSWPDLKEWILRFPFKLIRNIGEKCSKLVKVIQWFENNPNHYMYVRQLDIQGIDTKFIENNGIVLGELLSLILPEEQVNLSGKTFEERFYLKQKPKMIRFRILSGDPIFSDNTVDIEEFSNWDLPFENVFITENEINFLSFPNVNNSCIIFGRGYGVDLFKKATYIKTKKVYYWGDIDTHGFNILSIARGFLPNLKSFLMTEEVLLSHRELWSCEVAPKLGEVKNLNEEENDLFIKLQTNYYGEGVRLEQERITFGLVESFVENLK